MSDPSPTDYEAVSIPEDTPLRRDVLEQQPSRDMSSGTKALLEDLFHELTVDELDDVLDE